MCHQFPGWLAASGLAGFLLSSAAAEPCDTAERPERAIPSAFADPPPPPRVVFADISASIASPQLAVAPAPKEPPGSLGSGCAFFDYDDDGDEDILLVDAASSCAGRAARRPRSALRLLANNGKGEFRDVTSGSRLGGAFHAMGVAVGDYDNDGLRDVFVTGIGKGGLWRNEGSGRFRDITGVSGLGGLRGRWTTSAAWLDYNNDGLLDLFVCGFAQSDTGRNNADGGLLLYRNNGKGRLTDASSAAGLGAADVCRSRIMALAPIDLNDDGWMDIVVSTDGGRNLVFRNKGDGTFVECGVACGLAYDSAGNEQHSRGIDVDWCRDDSRLQIAMSAAHGEGLKLYSGRGLMSGFADQAPSHGLAAATRKCSLFGIVFLDYDLDGWPDLLAVGGHAGALQEPRLFWNTGQHGEEGFQLVSSRDSGQALFTPMSGRGIAYADIDGDNDQDVLITQNDGDARLLRNDQQSGNRALRVRLIGTKSARDAIGARITLRSGGHFWRAQVMPSRGYLSQSELAVTFGLGSEESVRDMEIRWPSGLVQKLRVKSTERSITVVEPVKDSLAEAEP